MDGDHFSKELPLACGKQCNSTKTEKTFVGTTVYFFFQILTLTKQGDKLTFTFSCYSLSSVSSSVQSLSNPERKRLENQFIASCILPRISIFQLEKDHLFALNQYVNQRVIVSHSVSQPVMQRTSQTSNQ